MSRVGKMPVSVPQGVDVAIKDDQINVKGALGTLALTKNPLVTITSDDGKLTFAPALPSDGCRRGSAPRISKSTASTLPHNTTK